MNSNLGGLPGPNQTRVAIAKFPVIDTPLTRLFEGWLTAQGGRCQDMELDWTRCAASCGITRAATECSKYYEDFKECMNQRKTTARYAEIQKEHKKQGTMKEPPPKDSIRRFHNGVEYENMV